MCGWWKSNPHERGLRSLSSEPSASSQFRHTHKYRDPDRIRTYNLSIRSGVRLIRCATGPLKRAEPFSARVFKEQYVKDRFVNVVLGGVEPAISGFSDQHIYPYVKAPFLPCPLSFS